MKKLIITLVAAMFGCALANAQDLNSAIETYNNAVTANEAGNLELALTSFKEALTQAEALGDEGAAVASDCKTAIPAVQFNIAKRAVNNKDYENAIAGLRASIEIAGKYGNDDIAVSAADLIPQVLMQKANEFYSNKNYAEAVEGYKAVLAEDANNGVAYLRLGDCLKATGEKDAAVEAFKSAIENGRENDGKKKISTLYQQEAKAALGAKKFDAALNSALEANKYLESATSYQIAGTAASAAKKQKEAIGYFEKYLELEPNAKNATQICYNVAVCYQQLGNKAKAKEYYQKAVNDPKVGAAAKQMLNSL